MKDFYSREAVPWLRNVSQHLQGRGAESCPASGLGTAGGNIWPYGCGHDGPKIKIWSGASNKKASHASICRRHAKQNI